MSQAKPYGMHMSFICIIKVSPGAPNVGLTFSSVLERPAVNYNVAAAMAPWRCTPASIGLCAVQTFAQMSEVQVPTSKD